jgi:hypothetical protein
MASISNIQEVDVTVSFKFTSGADVQVRNIAWSVSDSAIIDVAVSVEDAAKAVVASKGPIGVAKVFVQAEYVQVDADGVETAFPVSGEAEVVVTEAGVVVANFEFGEPRNR